MFGDSEQKENEIIKETPKKKAKFKLEEVKAFNTTLVKEKLDDVMKSDSVKVKDTNKKVESMKKEVKQLFLNETKPRPIKIKID